MAAQHIGRLSELITGIDKGHPDATAAHLGRAETRAELLYLLEATEGAMRLDLNSLECG